MLPLMYFKFCNTLAHLLKNLKIPVVNFEILCTSSILMPLLEMLTDWYWNF